MITVREDYDHMTITMEGHADAMQENGVDAVCAAASMILQTLVYSISQDVRLQLVNSIEKRLEPGDAMVRIVPHPLYVARAMHKYQMACDGLEMLAQNYPQSIRIM